MHRIFFSVIAALGATIAVVLGLKMAESLGLKLAVFLGVICFIMASLLNYHLYPKFFQKQMTSLSNQAVEGTKTEE